MDAEACEPSCAYASLRNLPKRDELAFRKVCALPNASRTGDDCRTRSVSSDVMATRPPAVAAAYAGAEYEAARSASTEARDEDCLGGGSTCKWNGGCGGRGWSCRLRLDGTAWLRACERTHLHARHIAQDEERARARE
eukprot:scaffold131125_cov26-Tisochrysis_lutea.AAC.2